MKNNYHTDLPKPLQLSAKEKDNLRKGGKILYITLAAGNGHLEMWRRIKDSLQKTYPDLITEDTFVDPVSGAEHHPGVWAWNTWQKDEKISGLKLLVAMQYFVDLLHAYLVRINLCRFLIEADAVKVLDTQTNSTIATCKAVSDYNLYLSGRFDEIDDRFVKVYHAVCGPRDFFYLLIDPKESLFMRFCMLLSWAVFSIINYVVFLPLIFIAKSGYDFSLEFLAYFKLEKSRYLVKSLALFFPLIVVFPFYLLLDLGKSVVSVFVGSPKSPSVLPKVKGPVSLVKVLTDVPVYDEHNIANSTVNYFDSMNRLSEKYVKQSNLSIVSPPLAMDTTPNVKTGVPGLPDEQGVEGKNLKQFWGYCRGYFGSPLKKTYMRERVHYTDKNTALVRSGFKEAELPETFGEGGVRKYNKQANTFNVSVMLGGNGGQAFISYVQSLAQYFQAFSKAYPNSSLKCEITLFCGKSYEDIKSKLDKLNLPKNLEVKPLGFIKDANEIAAVIKQADLHITRPGGISTFELDTMSHAPELLFHTPTTDGSGKPSLDGLVNWERSNPMWLLMRKDGCLSSLQSFKSFFSKHLNLFSKKKDARMNLDRVYTSIIEATLKDYLVSNNYLTNTDVFLNIMKAKINNERTDKNLPELKSVDKLQLNALQPALETSAELGQSSSNELTSSSSSKWVSSTLGLSGGSIKSGCRTKQGERSGSQSSSHSTRGAGKRGQ